MKVKFKIFDIISLAFSLVLLVCFFLLSSSLRDEDGYLLVQDISGESLYPLSEDREIRVEGPAGLSVIVVEDGSARFESSACRDSLCVHMGSIDQGGEWAACLPNRVFIYIEGGEPDETDALSY